MAKKPSKAEPTPSALSTSEGADGESAFPMPDFDEKAFMRREVESAKISFWTAGAGLVAGVAAWLVGWLSPDWRVGWLPIVLSMAVLGPALKKMKFSDDQTAPKAMIGNWFLLFFTALSVWIVLVNMF